MEEKFCLKWNDYQENTIKTFSKLRKEEDFYDVTLVSEDKKLIMAHKVVLSSSSEYFKSILKSNKHPPPMICLSEIASMELENVLDYIYQGEIQIFQENIDKFLKIAQRLQIDGLLSLDTDIDGQQYMSNQSMETKTKNETIEASQKSNENKFIINRNSDHTSRYDISLNDRSSVDEIELKVTENLVKNSNGDYTCNICGKEGGKHIRNMKNHIETHLDGISFSCSICGKQFRSRNSMNSHKTQFHKNK